MLLAAEDWVDLVGECQNGVEAIAAIQKLRPDLVFLDVQMPGASGFDVIGAVGASHMPCVVFVTAFDQYALKAFDVHALDYLLKPFDRERLERALERLRAALASAGRSAAPRRPPPLERLGVERQGRVRLVEVGGIDWIEADGKRVLLHAAGEVLPLRQPLRALEERLDPRRFARVHRGSIVRVGAIRELCRAFHGDWIVLLQRGERVVLSRRYCDRLRALLGAS
jgi:two-component system LytT family response regulator